MEPAGGLSHSEIDWARQHGFAPPVERVDPPLRADCATDFVAIEAEIARSLYATPDRCAFLRSFTYLRFRMRVLYHGRGAAAVIYTPCGVRVQYTPDERGGSVTVRPPYDPRAAAAALDGEEQCSEVQSSFRVIVPVRGPGRPRKCAQ